MSALMERIKFGNLWNELGQSDLILVTANGVVDGHGSLVMGAGAAREARLKFPGLDALAGQGLRTLREFDRVIYGVMLSPFNRQGTQVGLFQVKYHFKWPAEFGLMRASAMSLRRYARQYRRIAMNFPGVGHGGLELRRALPMLSALPSNVTLYLYPNQEAECRTILNGMY